MSGKLQSLLKCQLLRGACSNQLSQQLGHMTETHPPPQPALILPRDMHAYWQHNLHTYYTSHCLTIEKKFYAAEICIYCSLMNS